MDEYRPYLYATALEKKFLDTLSLYHIKNHSWLTELLTSARALLRPGQNWVFW